MCYLTFKFDVPLAPL